MTQLISNNPATGETVGTVDVTPADAVADVVARARAAQPAWAALGLDARLEKLAAAGERVKDRADELGRLACLEMGKPLRQATGEARYAASLFASDLEEMRAAFADEVNENAKVRTTIVRDPFGVVASITPWNFPVLMPHQHLLPALAAGNAVVFKPSEETPLTGAAYAECLQAALPDGVLSVVHGDEAQGKALVHSDVDLIVFTGSRAAGKHILATAANDLKRVVLELGGKDPLVVLDDADVGQAARFAAKNSFRNSGQVCVSTERIYVGAPLFESFVTALVEETKKLRVGDGAADAGVDLGPMVNERQRALVLAQLDDAAQKGATVAYRGEAPDGGTFLPPVVLTDVDDTMDIARDETFGPVACVLKVASEDEAVARANDTPYGLGAVVFGAPEHARAVARKMDAGMIGVNQGLSNAGSAPWVGAKQSGHGFHSSTEGHRQFAQVRVLSERK